jgi:hypothetical protein
VLTSIPAGGRSSSDPAVNQSSGSLSATCAFLAVRRT